MPSNWNMFWSYPVIYVSHILIRAWYGQIYTIEIEFLSFSLGWFLVLFVSILLDRLFGRVSTSKIDQEKEIIRRFIKGERANTRDRKP